jgi:Spy/CpxP family protein refolding chaperone
MKNTKLVLTLLMCGLLGMPLVYAKDKGGKHMGGKAEVFDQLNLSAEQKKQLEASKEAQMEQIKGLLNQMTDLSKKLNEELMKPKLDMSAVNDLNNQLKAIQGQMADKRISTILDVRKTLTPEQFNKFITLTEELRAKHRAARHGDGAMKK